MSDPSVSINPQPGESMVDAMLRTANERAKAEIAAGIRQEPVPALGRKGGKSGVKRGPKSDTPSGAPAPRRKDGVLPTAATKGGDPNSGSPVEEQIVSCIHFYRRPDETDAKVTVRARQEREMHGPNVLIFNHAHPFGGACDRDCKVRVTV